MQKEIDKFRYMTLAAVCACTLCLSPVSALAKDLPTLTVNLGEVAPTVYEKETDTMPEIDLDFENMEFKEWNTKADGTGDKVNVGDKLNADTTVYAIWQGQQKSEATLDESNVIKDGASSQNVQNSESKPNSSAKTTENTTQNIETLPQLGALSVEEMLLILLGTTGVGGLVYVLYKHNKNSAAIVTAIGLVTVLSLSGVTQAYAANKIGYFADGTTPIKGTVKVDGKTYGWIGGELASNKSFSLHGKVLKFDDKGILIEKENTTNLDDSKLEPVKPNDNTKPTNPDNTGTTTPAKPDEGASTPTKPDEGATTPTKPDNNTGTTTPTKPDEGTTTPTKPDEGTSTPTKPDEGTSTTTPTKPDEGTSTETTEPDDNTTTTPTTPDEGTTTEPTEPAETKNGIVEENGKKYLYKDGEKLSGWQTVDGKKVYADPEDDNALVTLAWKKIDGKTYYFWKDSYAVSGENQIDGAWYMFDRSTNEMRVGWYHHVKGTSNRDKWCYYDRTTGKMLYGEQHLPRDNSESALKGEWFYYNFAKDGGVQYGWAQKPNGAWRYYKAGSAIQAYPQGYFTHWKDSDWNLLHTMWVKAQKMQTKTNYKIVASVGDYRVAIFQTFDNGASWEPIYVWQCVGGDVNKGHTAAGQLWVTHKTSAANYNNPDIGWTAFHPWNFQIRQGDYQGQAFHYWRYKGRTMNGSGSDGCIMLDWNETYWIWKNIPWGTGVYSIPCWNTYDYGIQYMWGFEYGRIYN